MCRRHLGGTPKVMGMSFWGRGRFIYITCFHEINGSVLCFCWVPWWSQLMAGMVFVGPALCV